MGWPKSLSVPKGATLTVTGPAKSAHDFELLSLAMNSKGTVIFNGPTELHDKKTGKLLATITGGSLPGTLHFTATAAGQNHGRKCVDDVKTMKAATISCSAAKAMVGCSHDLHASFPKMPAGSLVSTICRQTCKACFSEPTRAGMVTKKVGGGKAVVKPKGLIQLRGSRAFPGGRILTPAMNGQLSAWMQQKGLSSAGGWQLCYSSPNGDPRNAPSAWHSRCDGHPRTVVVGSFNGATFGGYHSGTWSSLSA
jgi:hypothetical protein